MLVIRDDEIVRIPDPAEEVVSKEKTVKKGKKKEPVYTVFCTNCNSFHEIKQEDLCLRSKYGIPINSFYCPHCKRRNYFFSEKYALSRTSIKILQEYEEN